MFLYTLVLPRTTGGLPELRLDIWVFVLEERNIAGKEVMILSSVRLSVMSIHWILMWEG